MIVFRTVVTIVYQVATLGMMSSGHSYVSSLFAQNKQWHRALVVIQVISNCSQKALIPNHDFSVVVIILQVHIKVVKYNNFTFWDNFAYKCPDYDLEEVIASDGTGEASVLAVVAVTDIRNDSVVHYNFLFVDVSLVRAVRLKTDVRRCDICWNK